MSQFPIGRKIMFIFVEVHLSTEKLKLKMSDTNVDQET